MEEPSLQLTKWGPNMHILNLSAILPMADDHQDDPQWTLHPDVRALVQSPLSAGWI